MTFHKMRYVFQVAAWLLVLAIVYLSVVPPEYRISTNLPQPLEHFLIFLLAGLAFGLGYPYHYPAQSVALGLFAAGIELVQVWGPGRHSRLSDLVVGFLGSVWELAWPMFQRDWQGAVRRYGAHKPMRMALLRILVSAKPALVICVALLIGL
jgi:VanZ family protein